MALKPVIGSRTSHGIRFLGLMRISSRHSASRANIVTDLEKDALGLVKIAADTYKASMRILSFLLLATLWIYGCTTPLLGNAPAPKPTCANIDWYEIGRADGRAGSAPKKLQEYHRRCDPLGTPPADDLYMNGRELGLLDFCTPTSGVDAGRNGIPNHDVCPEHLKEEFATNYEIGLRIRELESADSDLKSRIDNLRSLLTPKSTSVRAQIEQLENRRAQIDAQIGELEREAQ